MVNDKEYDEIEAVVRVPKGERLADSRKTEGWSRGFTPKSSEKGPEHVEIRLKDGGALPSTREPEVIYVTEYVERPGSRELTPEQQATADFVRDVLNGLIEVATPYVAEWWDTRLRPAIVATLDDLVQRRRERRAVRKGPRATVVAITSTGEETVEEGSSSQQLAVAEGPAVTMTSEEFRHNFVLWLAREDAQRALWDAIVHADIQDANEATLEWKQRLRELSPEQRTQRVNEFLSANPSILADLGRHFLDSGPVDLGETVRRREEA